MDPKLKIKPLHVLATRIGRQPRFAGATGKYWWSVLHHSFLVETIICDMAAKKKCLVRDAARLYALIHDLHEAYTGDIPTPFKDDSIRAFQRGIDALICQALAIPEPHWTYRDFVKEADDRAMWAEAVVLADNGCWLDESYYALAAEKAIPGDKEHVTMLLRQYGSPTLTQTIYSRGVQDYIREVTLGVQNCKRLHKGWSEPKSDYILKAHTDIAPFIPNPGTMPFRMDSMGDLPVARPVL